MANELRTISGVKDLVDDELLTYNRVVEIGCRIAKQYNYSKIILPIFEHAATFLRTLGQASDIVTKETYTFSDRDKRTITLRPEFTAAMVRAIISNRLTQPMPRRFFTYGPLFRHERPQHGRNRQFYQFDCEFFGSASPLADVEVISILYTILKELDLHDKIQVEINTLGDKISFVKYTEAIKEYFTDNYNKLSDISKERLLKSPLRILDSKEEEDHEVIQQAPVISNYINQESLDHYSAVCAGLDALNIKYVHNSRLVRGLDYYTHTVFEFTTNKLGSQNAIAAGGRYNDLVEAMGGPSIPAVGFAVGIDRLHELLKQFNLTSNKQQNNVCYMIPIGDAAEMHAVALANDLREKGLKIVLDYNMSTKKRLMIANREKARLCIIFGEDEIKKSEYIVRDMLKSIEKKVYIDELDEVVIQILQE